MRKTLAIPVTGVETGAEVFHLDSAAEVIVRDAEARIRLRNLPPGHRLGTKQELCAEYGVAPGTLAEALRVPRARGAVEVRQGPGCRR